MSHLFSCKYLHLFSGGIFEVWVLWSLEKWTHLRSKKNQWRDTPRIKRSFTQDLLFCVWFNVIRRIYHSNLGFDSQILLFCWPRLLLMHESVILHFYSTSNRSFFPFLAARVTTTSLTGWVVARPCSRSASASATTRSSWACSASSSWSGRTSCPRPECTQR